jgi:hypothetical protein
MPARWSARPRVRPPIPAPIMITSITCLRTERSGVFAVLSRKSAIAEEIGHWRADVVSQGRPFSGTGAPWANYDLRRGPPEDGRTGGEIVGRNEYS